MQQEKVQISYIYQFVFRQKEVVRQFPLFTEYKYLIESKQTRITVQNY